MKKLISFLIALTGVAEIIFIALLCKEMQTAALWAFIAMGVFGWSALICGAVDAIRRKNSFC